MVNVPALVLGRRMDILAWNSLSSALFTDYSRLPAKRRNHIWLTFLDPEVRGLYANWEQVAQEWVAYLRMDAWPLPELARLVGELSLKDHDFAGGGPTTRCGPCGRAARSASTRSPGS